MRLRYPELRLAYKKDTGMPAEVEGMWVEARIGSRHGDVIIGSEDCPETFVNEIASEGGFSVPDMGYLEWLEDIIVRSGLIPRI